MATKELVTKIVRRRYPGCRLYLDENEIPDMNRLPIAISLKNTLL